MLFTADIGYLGTISFLCLIFMLCLWDLLAVHKSLFCCSSLKNIAGLGHLLHLTKIFIREQWLQQEINLDDYYFNNKRNRHIARQMWKHKKPVGFMLILLNRNAWNFTPPAALCTQMTFGLIP